MKKSEINIDIFKRNVSLHKLGIGELSDVELKLYCFFKEHISDLKPFYSDNYINCVFWGKSKEEIVLVYDSDSLKVEKYIWDFMNEISKKISSRSIINYLVCDYIKNDDTFIFCGSLSISEKFPRLQLSIYEKE